MMLGFGAKLAPLARAPSCAVLLTEFHPCADWVMLDRDHRLPFAEESPHVAHVLKSSGAVYAAALFLARKLGGYLHDLQRDSVCCG